MPNQITGRLIEIGKTVQIPSKSGGSPFMKRDFLLDATTYDHYTGERSEFENILPLEVSGEKCAELDRFQVGDVVTVSFALQGRQWTNQDGELRRMVSIRCYKLESRQIQKTQPSDQQPEPQPAPVPEQQTMFPPDGMPENDLPF